VRLQRPLAPGKQFILEIGGGGGAVAGAGARGGGPADAASLSPLRYRVVRCKPLGQGAFHVGAEFVRTPAPAPAVASKARTGGNEASSNARPASPPPSSQKR
jgi:hypothetical protein